MSAEAATITLERRRADGTVAGSVALDPSYFGLPVNVPLLHQVVTAQLAARRAGTQSTRTRAEVAGGSAKPYRQKGTGNARQGSIRAPHYTGGGIALGPKPRGYEQRTPKKMVQQALRCALSDRARDGGIRLVEDFGLDVPKTKAAVALLGALGADGRVLVVCRRDDEVTQRSFANLPHVVTVPPDQLTAYDVLCADVVVFSDDTLPGATAEAAASTPARRRSSPRAAASARESAAETSVDAEPAEEEQP